MSWHEEFLSENNKKPTISTMGDLFNLIEEVYEVEKGTLFKEAKSELQVLKEQFLNERKSMTLTLDAIPEIAVTELGWTDVTGAGGDNPVNGPERQKLLQFLENIEGGDFVEKIRAISNFYDNPDAAMQSMFGEGGSTSTAKQIATALSYLVFYKTLTKVIANFNAASAGFSFEAFLAVLMEGEQIPANTGTIADFLSRSDGTAMPVSLKLYQDGNLHVGGSFRDLVGDITNPKFDNDLMRYVAVTKRFEGGQKEGQDVNGFLKWYRFDFTLDNIFDILSKSSKHSRLCIQLPKKGQAFIDNLPGIAEPSAEEMENKYALAFTKEMEAMNAKTQEELQVDDAFVQQFLKNLSWATQLSDKFFVPFDPDAKLSDEQKTSPDYEPRAPYVKRGTSPMHGSGPEFAALIQVVLGTLAQVNDTLSEPRYNLEDRAITNLRNGLAINIARRAKAANNGGGAADKLSILKQYSATKETIKRNKRLNLKSNWFSPEESTRLYNAMSREQKLAALVQTRGFLSTEQFGLTQNMVAEIHTYSKSRVLGPNQDKAFFGAINVGRKNTQMVLNRVTGLLNESLFDIFVNVKAIQDNTYAYIAGGMQEDTQAEEAIKASGNVISKTEELQSAKDK
ncbi:MAG: hypothetical protein CBD51_003070 [Flavobacteriales bacterium TMED191]|nr:MAG: hypothetical protein CBD51_003070 [Flavobacteriales bacterium TMED191]